jgi:hypothetical protein
MTDDQQRDVPFSELDYNLRLTDAVWGKQDVSDGLREKSMINYETTDDKGNVTNFSESLWELLSFYTRDVRLGNLNPMDGELQAVRNHLKIAGFYLFSDMIGPFHIRLSKAISILETSQSKNGFFRKLLNTLRHENFNQNLEPPRRGFFGGGKNMNGGGN